MNRPISKGAVCIIKTDLSAPATGHKYVASLYNIPKDEDYTIRADGELVDGYVQFTFRGVSVTNDDVTEKGTDTLRLGSVWLDISETDTGETEYYKRKTFEDWNCVQPNSYCD